MAELEEGRLYKLSELDDYEVNDEDPDVRGWEVVASDKKSIGKVDELIVDMDAMKVRYLDVRVNDDISGVDNQHLLLPIGTAFLDEKKDIVYADNVQTVTLLKYPKFEGGPVTREYENNLRRTYNPDFTADTEEKDYYNNEYYNEEKFYASRRQRSLFRLYEMQGYEIEGIDPDIRNWEVVTLDEKRIGKVYELVVDPKARKVRYIEVASEIDRGEADEDQHILIPVGLASLDEDADRVKVRLDYTSLTRFPLYRGGSISRTYENSLRNAIKTETMTSKDADDYYDHEYYNDSGFYGRRGSGVRWV